MATTALRGNPVTTIGELPAPGSVAPDFVVTGADLKDVALADFAGRRIVLNIFPSVDTGVCATSVRRFNELASGLENTSVVCVSADLPFALGRFCGANGITSDIERIPIQKINEAYERMLASDVKYRFVIEMESLKG